MFHLRDFEDRFRLQLLKSTVIGFVVRGRRSFGFPGLGDHVDISRCRCLALR